MVHLLEEMEGYARAYNVPIMEKEGIQFLTSLIRENQIKSILEIGSAIGYSAIQMALIDPEIRITTIERDEIRYQEAVKNIEKAGLKNRITILFMDAFSASFETSFDMVFIDAAKSQYTKFFEKFKQNLNENGIIVTDNLKFHGLVGHAEEIKSKNLRSMVRKIQNYLQFLNENEEFHTTFYEIGDGVGVSKRISNN